MPAVNGAYQPYGGLTGEWGHEEISSLERCVASIRHEPHDRVSVDLHNFMMTLAGVQTPPPRTPPATTSVLRIRCWPPFAPRARKSITASADWATHIAMHYNQGWANPLGTIALRSGMVWRRMWLMDEAGRADHRNLLNFESRQKQPFLEPDPLASDGRHSHVCLRFAHIISVF